jgi:predicted nucleotidyltransferase
MTDPITYSVTEAAKVLDVSLNTVRNRARKLKLGKQNGGGVWTFTPDELRQMLRGTR